MEIWIPEKVKYILERINQAGFEAYVVGGCVRDSLLGRTPNDWDITTSAYPYQIKEIFPKTIDTGVQHGTVTVLYQQEGFEVTTYRIDGAYEDGRHPKQVSFTACLGEDLKRRDFTINAMAYHPAHGVIDLFDGQGDMKKKIVRCVGDARERFTEDALRILRAVRFAAQLDFEIEEQTRYAILELAQNLKQISKERIQTELVKLLTSDHPQVLRTGWELGITQVVLPEFDRMMEQAQPNDAPYPNVGEHTIAVICGVRPDKQMRLAALLHDIGKTEVGARESAVDVSGESAAKKVLRRLKFDNHTTDTVCRLVRYHDTLLNGELSERRIRHVLHEMGVELFPALLELMYADGMEKSEGERRDAEKRAQRAGNLYQYIVEQGQCVNLKDLAVKGSDLIAAGMKPGKEMGMTLQAMLDYVLDYPQANQKEELLTRFVGCSV